MPRRPTPRAVPVGRRRRTAPGHEGRSPGRIYSRRHRSAGPWRIPDLGARDAGAVCRASLAGGWRMPRRACNVSDVSPTGRRTQRAHQGERRGSEWPPGAGTHIYEVALSAPRRTCGACWPRGRPFLGTRDLERPVGSGKLAGLPRRGQGLGGSGSDGVCRLFENSTVCLIGQCQTCLFEPLLVHFGFGLSCSAWSGQYHLSPAPCGCWWCFSFTESLILAQDERWRRA